MSKQSNDERVETFMEKAEAHIHSPFDHPVLVAITYALLAIAQALRKGP